MIGDQRMANKDGFGSGLDQLDENMGQTSRMTAEFEAELARLRQSMSFTSREVGTLSSGIESGLRRAFDGLIFDGDKLSEALKGIGRTIADTVFSIAMKPVESALAGSVANGMAGMVSGAMPFAQGGAFVQGRVMPFAKGGVVSEPTRFPMRGAATRCRWQTGCRRRRKRRQGSERHGQCHDAGCRRLQAQPIADRGTAWPRPGARRTKFLSRRRGWHFTR